MARVALLLRASPLATAEIAERLGLSPSEASRYLAAAVARGVIRYDLSQKRYALGSVG
nr:helix-turn-helix domain-containing protein [Deferrisoma camini]